MTADLQEQIACLKYNETLRLPKLLKSVERLINQYQDIMTDYHVSREKLMPLLEKALYEKNAFIVQREYNGYMVIVWHDRQPL